MARRSSPHECMARYLRAQDWRIGLTDGMQGGVLQTVCARVWDYLLSFADILNSMHSCCWLALDELLVRSCITFRPRRASLVVALLSGASVRLGVWDLDERTLYSRLCLDNIYSLESRVDVHHMSATNMLLQAKT